MPFPARILEHNGRTQKLDAWSAETGIPAETIRSRLDILGWPVSKALSTPTDKRFRRGGRHRSRAPRPCPILREDAKGRAFVRWRAHGGDHYRSFGVWGSPEAVAAFRRFAAEWATGAFEVKPSEKVAGVSVSELLLGWLLWADREYRKLGKRTSTYHVWRSSARLLRQLYGDTPAESFGPHQLRAVRQGWIDQGKTRKTINTLVYGVTRAFGWAVGQAMIPPAVHQALLQVERLRPGRTSAPDRPKVRPVTPAAVAAALEQLPDTPRSNIVRVAVCVQRLTGMRPQHLCEMRAGDIDRTEPIWVYTPPPSGTKTFHLGKCPRFYLGPKAQAAILPLLDGKAADRHVFSYTMKGKRVYRLSVSGFGKAIKWACEEAGCVPWHPHQLRHALATEVAATTGSIEKAAAAIGDTIATAARVYVALDPQERMRREIAELMG
jgi:integrase